MQKSTLRMVENGKDDRRDIRLVNKEGLASLLSFALSRDDAGDAATREQPAGEGTDEEGKDCDDQESRFP